MPKPAIALLLLIAGCGDRAATLDEAKAAVEANLPSGPAYRFAQASDLGDKWRLVYVGQGTAGAAFFEVDKRRGAIISQSRGQ